VRVDQLAFGYDDGHRFLRGSRALPPASLSRLLGATDAAPGSDEERLLTGLPLPEDRLFALCFTWTAWEIRRPGAVWAHVLLLTNEQVGALESPLVLTGWARRPDPLGLDSFDEPLQVPDAVVAGDHPTPSTASEAVWRKLVTAAYDERGPGIAVEPDLIQAEAALGGIWRAQWPELRARFGFRTRDSIRANSKRTGLVAARRLQGSRPPKLFELSPRLSRLADLLRDDGPHSLPAFLHTFGPFDAATPASVPALASIYETANTDNWDLLARKLEDRYPSTATGSVLKDHLFGISASASFEGDRNIIRAILSSTIDAWDTQALRLEHRVKALMAQDGPQAVAEALAPNAPKPVRRAVVQALLGRSKPTDLAAFAGTHLHIVEEVAHLAPAMLLDQELWRVIEQPDAVALLRNPSLPPEVLQVCISSGRTSAALEALSLPGVLASLSHLEAVAEAGAVLKEHAMPAALWAELDDGVVLLMTAAGHIFSIDRSVAALEALREEPNDLWLRAAVAALASPDADRGSVLSTVFGPVHDAITSDRLPRECWQDLDRVLPPAHDPALRLRRLLLAVARSESWSEDRMTSALRDAGPFTAELLHEFEQHDEWYNDAVKAVFRTFGWRDQ
jgi:hypothetical protein